MSSSYTSISPDKLSPLIGTAAAPTLIDVHIDKNFSVDPRLIQAPVRRSYLEVQDSASRRDVTKETHNWPTHKVR